MTPLGPQDSPMRDHGHVRLSRALAHVPVTALALHRAPSGRLFALAGIDNAVVVYDADAHAAAPVAVSSICVFASQPIHGIQVHGAGATTTVLVWGAREAAVFALTDGFFADDGGDDDAEGGSLRREGRRREMPAVVRATAPDWICDGAISPHDPHVAVLATAHNEIVALRYDPSARRLSLSAAVCPARPMLFTARVVWESEDAVLVAGGTVFGHIIVWRCRLGGDGPAAVEFLFNLQGFEGSIFGVDMSAPMGLTDGTTVRLLAGCSDDRTIRVWDISERGGSTASGSEFRREVDTGFGGDFDEALRDGEAEKGSASSPAPVAVVGMGHASRIWGVRFAPACNSDTLPVYSFGEDAVAQRWLLKLSGQAFTIPSEATAAATSATATAPNIPLAGKLSPDQAHSLHHGKHLWAHALLAEDDDSLTIATGGADSQINVIRTSLTHGGSASSVTRRGSITLDVHDILRSMASPTSPAAAKEIISRYDFLTHDHILVTTNQGRLLLGSLHGREDWQEIAVDGVDAEALRSCYVLRTIADGSALLGTTAGQIFLFQLRTKQVSRVAAVPGKIVDISCLSAKKPDAQDIKGVLVFLHGQADLHHLSIDLSKRSLRSHGQIKGLDPRFVATSAAAVNDDLIIIGSRHGWISITKRESDQGAYRPVLNLATRSFDSITAIVSLPQKTGPSHHAPLYILVTSKDGKYRIYEIAGQGDSLRLQLRHETCPPFGPVIADAWFTNGPSPELMLCGFRSKAFVIWNESRKEEVANVDCGGAHRTYQLVYDEQDTSRYRFAFTKTSKLSLHSSAGPTHRSLKTGVHGREIKALCSSGRYIASGAEDTSIRIWEHHPERGGTNAEIVCVATMKAHVTGIQRLAWFEEDYLFSSAGNEEFFVWRVREQDSSYRGLAVYCEAELEEKSADGDLRIMDFDVCRRGDGILLVTMVFSNSTLKTFSYTCRDRGRFELVAKGSYTGACLTQIRLLSVQEDVLHLLAASTDGHLTVWRASTDQGTCTLEEAAQLHQNSIKSLDLLVVEEGYIIFTGGDDNAVGVSLVEGRAGQGWRIASRGLVRRAHAAAVTGVALMRGTNDDDIFGVSSGNDQSVKGWRISGGRTSCTSTTKSAPLIRLVGEAPTGVADVGDLALLKSSLSSSSSSSSSPASTSIVIGGVGLEIWTFLLD